MMTRFELKSQLEDFVNRVGDGSTHGWYLHLVYMPGFTLSVDTEWTDVAGFLCDFKGYSPGFITGAYFTAPADEGDTEYVETTTIIWFYNSGAASADTRPTATHMVLTRNPVSVGDVELIDMIELDAPMTFAADGDMLERKYRRYAMNCAE